MKKKGEMTPMKKRSLLLCILCTLCLLAGCAGEPAAPSAPSVPDMPALQGDISKDWSFVTQGDNGGIETVGLYVWDPNPAQYPFWKACGYNLLQFCDRSWFWNSNTTAFESYLTNMQNGTQRAKEEGFAVNMLFFSNISQYEGPAATEPTGLGIKFHPDDEAALQARLDALRVSLSYMSAVDSFTIIAGDPGGISNDMGEGDVYDFIKLAKAMAAVIREVYPDAEVNLNPWAAAMYQTPNVSAHVAEFWQREAQIGSLLLADEQLLGPDLGLELACHDYYRPLALQAYANAGAFPDELFPTRNQIQTLLSRGTERVWAWPYFLLDEADDGHAGVERTTLPQLESRYITRYLKQIRESGFNGAIGNWSYAGYQTKMFNLYAFARSCHDQSLTPEQLLGEFCCAIATPETRPALLEVLKYIENDSNFAQKTPSFLRQRKFEVTLQSDQEALDLLKTVLPNTDNQFPLPYSPAEYLADLAARLEWSMQLPQ